MRTLSLLLLLLVCSTGCGPKHVMLWTGESGTGSLFECDEKNNNYTCAPSKNETLVKETLSGTIYINLPKDCGGRFHQILLHDVRWGDPQVFVKCAPPENSSGSTP
jgi:hypothetical protein